MSSTLKILEAADENGVLCTYDKDDNPRVIKAGQNPVKDLMGVFLPAGYPRSVREDYTAYQVYDSLQAFSSTIAGLLSSRAVLQGFGIGDSGSSATTAVLFTVVQECTGRLATILFAHRYGRAIEAECKFYRFFADIVNDSALFLDILSPALPTWPKVLALCGAGMLRALCGVSGGAAKASLSAHFAKNGNLAELNAKDGSQETVISLMGLLAGSLLLQFVHGKQAVMTWMIGLVTIHLWTNYKAVRAVRMRTLNKQRLCIIIDELVRSGRVPTHAEVADRERILTWTCPKVTFASTYPKAKDIHGIDIYSFVGVEYLILRTKKGKVIYLKEHATSWDMVQAWIEAYSGARLDDHKALWKLLFDARWDIKTNALETGRAIRLLIGVKEEDGSHIDFKI
ncbi:DUF647-domain-containing protein [Hypomontagnella monticulosa]|nr:DUF647-domain-containing protein [Hypomontagnella monticulosa]